MVESDDDGERHGGPDKAAIRAALDHVLASDAFRGAPQLSAFLTFIVERELEGRGGELKGYTIAVEAFGRPTAFDPQSDPIVRVEAGRLRKALGQFYAAEGAFEPVRITIPVGAYVPVFEDGPIVEGAVTGADIAEPEQETRREQSETAPPAQAGQPLQRWPASAWLVLSLVIVLELGLLAFLHWGGKEVLPADAQQQLIARASGLTAASTATQLPVIVVVVENSGADAALFDTARNFSRLLVDAMARFDDLIAVKAPLPGTNVTAGADYVLELNASHVGATTEGFGQLRSVRDGRIVWTTSASRTLERGAEDPELIEIARRLAIRLAEPFGIIHADFRQFSSSPVMNCLTRVLGFRRAMKQDEHLAARTCLMSLLETDPGFHPAWSQLARLTLYEHTHDLNPQPGSPLDRAMSAALTAVRLAPSSARAQQAVMDVLFTRGAIEDALAAGREATSRNPYDPDIMADIGAKYVQLNRPAEGLPLLQRAIMLSSGRPAWYDFFAFLGAHLTGAHALATSLATVFVADSNEFSLLGLALQQARKGDRAGLDASVRRLHEIAPMFGDDTRLYLERRGFAPVVIDRIMTDIGREALAAIGPR